MIAAQAPDHSDAGRAILESKLSFMAGKSEKPMPRKGRNASPEQNLQIACCKYLAILPATLYWATPNHMAGLTRKLSHGAAMNYMNKQRAAGFMAGVSDLTVIFRNATGTVTVCLPELKIGGNKLSEHQKEFAKKADDVGCVTSTIHSLNELIEMLKKAGHPYFERPAA